MATRIVLGTCHHDCPDSCGWEATVDEEGVAVALRGNPAHPYSQGELCPKVNHYLDRVYSPDRLLHPLVRVGPKGSGQFEQVSWDDALALIGERTQAAIARYGGETVLPWSSAGNQSLLSIGALAHRFFSRIGATEPTGSLCGATARVGTASTYGDGRGMDPMDLRHSRFIILWGTNTRITNRHLWPVIDRGPARRCDRRGDRPVAHGDGGERRLVRPTPARHGRGARAGDDARDHPRRARRHRLRRAAHHRVRRASRSRRRVDARAGGRDLRPRRNRHRAPCRCIRNDPSGRDPDADRRRAPRARRDVVPHRRLPSAPDRRLA